MQLTDQVALITGSGRGIGRTIALELASRGADVALNDLDKDTLLNTSKEIENLGRKCKIYLADVSELSAVEKMAENCLQDFGKIDILVNNAGITKDTLLVRMKEDDWDKVLKVNLKSTFLCSQAVAKIMMKQKKGRIINIASVIGLVGNIGQANYAASKSGIIGFTKSIARELAPRGITVNAICPGFIKTAMTDKLSEEVKNKMLSRIPLGVLGEPEDVANLVLYLVSDRARYITGQVISVDGGMVM